MSNSIDRPIVALPYSGVVKSANPKNVMPGGRDRLGLVHEGVRKGPGGGIIVAIGLALYLAFPQPSQAASVQTLWGLYHNFLNAKAEHSPYCRDFAYAYNAKAHGTSDDERAISDTTVLPAQVDPGACR
jgi:hypothetical protein